MKTKKQTSAKANTWKDAPIVELSLGEIALVAGGRRIIVYDAVCGCKRPKCKAQH